MVVVVVASERDEALALDAISVREFLSGRARTAEIYDEGFAQRIASQLESIVRSGDGALANRDKGFADRLATFGDSIYRFQRRLDLREEGLIQKFSSLERIVSGLQSQQGFLSSLG